MAGKSRPTLDKVNVAITDLKAARKVGNEYALSTFRQFEVFIQAAFHDGATLYDLCEQDGDDSADYHATARRIMGIDGDYRSKDQILLKWDIRKGIVTDWEDAQHKPVRMTPAGKRAYAELKKYMTVY